eukprot:TRINITY_DN2630_c0_g1_i1.p1 TRINITY_DN2630_c0_g1~~TRINITY_DN2630_c0_g1_i1.p1  ORF type:complete len:588 (-),score=126.87 TRINITY_DN2630_c0_g1_i1:60-1784(-)
MADIAGGLAKLTVEDEKPLALEDVVARIKSGAAKKIIVMSGAGLSTAAGIPDFRSPGTGLYDNLQKYNLPHPTAVFEIGYFFENPVPFCQLARELIPQDGRFLPTLCHYFITLLQRKGILLRNYTQNIDTLERHAGIETEFLVEAHGSFHSASCTSTHKPVDPKKTIEAIINGNIPRSPYKDGALVKPDIIFFGENLPPRFFQLAKKDFPQCDLLLVMGTSLQVQPFASMVHEVGSKCPRVLFNRDAVGVFGGKYDGKGRDVSVLGNLDDEIRRFADMLGWREELEALQAETNARLRPAGASTAPPDLPDLTDCKWEDVVVPVAAPLSAPAAPPAPVAPPPPPPVDETAPEAPPSASEEGRSFHINEALMMSVFSNNASLLAQLLQEGGDPNTVFPNQSKVMEKRGDKIVQTGSSATLLAVATMANKPQIVKTLLEHKANADDPDEGGSTSLMLAAQEGHLEIVQSLLDHGATVDFADIGGGTALIRACEGGHSEVAKLLIDRGADVNKRGIWVGGTPLYWATISGDSELVQYLLDHGADPNIRTNDGKSPLGLAVEFGNDELANLLRSKGALE